MVRNVLISIIVILALSSVAEERMKVVADSVNMRARPNTTVETVKPQFSEGDTVVVKGIEGEWAEIVPPESTDLYVYSAFVEDSVIQVSKLRVRSGPSINHKDVGMLNKGDKVEVRGRFGEWLKIAPPPGSSLWVSTKFLENPNKPKSVAKKPVKPKPKEKPQPPRDLSRKPQQVEKVDKRVDTESQPKKPIVRSVRHKPVQRKRATAWEQPQKREKPKSYVPEDLDLIPLEGQGAMMDKEGILRHTRFRLFTSAPANYRLVEIRGNGFITICYVKGNESQLKAFKGDRLKIKGRGYWVRGEEVPVVVPAQIMPE